MHVTGFEITQAWLADLAFGDPQWMPHPVRSTYNHCVYLCLSYAQRLTMPRLCPFPLLLQQLCL